MYPTKDTTHADEALAFLTDHYKGKIVIEGLLKAFAKPIQDLEDAIWDVVESFYLTKPPVGDQLDKIGTIVGAPREGLNDADYLAKVKIQIRVNRSAGLSEDILQVVFLALGHKADTYLDMPVAQFLVETWDYLMPNTLAGLLGHVRSVGTRGVLHYTTWADGSDFEWDSVLDTSAGELGWGSVYTSTVGGLMSAGSEF